MNSQLKIERQVAAMHQAIADRLRKGDEFPMQRALQNLARWRLRFGGELPPAYIKWEELLAKGVCAVLEVFDGVDERAVQLRSSSPFTGVLTLQERQRIMRDAA